ncbi:pyridoxal-5'-phosphate-dependent protein [Longibacter salinarum]|uniref:Pyridoxal-5'-phosphate-dependent protein n=1 Tax=Longibacter salinarum TaxID=1850348 RepID=A0A2A8D374_9BACT|nr:threo-3-hydroxy-L-aspartate ammonia-lyase [Longibacter salinarum]PEN15324.1 pyridoxal-5'-phosphate-dependent protein [Longibacter salinarum]
MTPSPPPSTLPVTYDDVLAAADRLRGVAHQTPVATSRTIDRRTDAQVFFKCENLQRIGAFKFRGAYNALSQLPADLKKRGVITYSSGNHAQAVALSGQLLGIETVIVMPDNAPRVKLEATQGYGAEIVTYDPEETVRESLGREIADERGLTLIPPYDHKDVVAGQGTVADELFQQVGSLDALLVCVGGGGLLSGCAIAAKHHDPDCQVIGVEPEAADDAARSFHSGTLHTVHNPDTVADGARTPHLGDVTFPLVRAHADDIVTVPDADIVRAMHFVWERMKLIIEPTGALAASALLNGTVPGDQRRIGVILSGGNVDLQRATELFNAYDVI